MRRNSYSNNEELSDVFRENFLQLLEKNGGAAKLAADTNIAPAQISRYASGSIPSLPTLIFLADWGCVTVDSLIYPPAKSTVQPIQTDNQNEDITQSQIQEVSCVNNIKLVNHTFVVGDSLEPLFFSKHQLELLTDNPCELLSIEVDDTLATMEFPIGSTIMIDLKDKSIFLSGWYLFDIDGTAKLRKVKKAKFKITISDPDSQTSFVLPLNAFETLFSIRAIGRIVWFSPKSNQPQHTALDDSESENIED